MGRNNLRNRITEFLDRSKHWKLDPRLPAWFHRIRRLDIDASLGRRRELQPRDFDEDISDLEEDVDEDEDEEEEEEKECDECGGPPGFDPECGCEPIDEEDSSEEDEDEYYSDAGSERSYCGSEADFYYEMKKMREARKRQLLLENKTAFTEEVKHHRVREKEILDAIGAIRQHSNKQANTTEHLEPLPDDTDEIQEKSEFSFTSSLAANGQVHGAMGIGRHTACVFEPFRLWNQNPKAITVKAKPKLEAESGHINLTFNFVGNDHVELKLTRESLGALSDILVDYLNLPAVLRFVGVKCDLVQEGAELVAARRAARRVARRAARSPSPRRTYFEMNHPMGWYEQSRRGLFCCRG
ncbi:hypothetical protein V8F06_008279 [Rhypophila decipiens]